MTAEMARRDFTVGAPQSQDRLEIAVRMPMLHPDCATCYGRKGRQVRRWEDSKQLPPRYFYHWRPPCPSPQREIARKIVTNCL